MIMPEYFNGSVVRTGGALTAAFSLVMGSLVLFVIPIRSAYLAAGTIIIFGFTFILGVLAFIAGKVFLR